MHMTRRYFLRTSGALAVYCGIAPFDVLADSAGLKPGNNPVRKHKTLVVIFLRGGMDGLNFIVPFKEANYYKMRGSIAIPAPGQANGAVDLDGFFGLHPQAASLEPLLKSGQATALNAVGYAHNTRSHFAEQDTWETGVVGNTVSSDGWLNRHLATSTGHGPIRALSIGDNLPRILQGDENAFAIRGLSDLTISKDKNPDPGELARVQAALEHAYCEQPTPEYMAHARELLAQSAGTTLEGLSHLRKVASNKYQPDAEYPENGFARKMRTVARLLKADIGLEVVEVTLDGWDTHNRQGGAEGNYASKVRVLSDALAAFNRDMGDRMNDVLVLTLSDFGRTAAENGTGGTDHGWANCMLALGGPVLRARKQQSAPVLGKWPGLSPEQLHQGRDLLHTTDFRDVIGEAVATHLDNEHLKTVLPDHTFQSVGFIA